MKNIKGSRKTIRNWRITNIVIFLLGLSGPWVDSYHHLTGWQLLTTKDIRYFLGLPAIILIYIIFNSIHTFSGFLANKKPLILTLIIGILSATINILFSVLISWIFGHALSGLYYFLWGYWWCVGGLASSLALEIKDRTPLDE